MKRIVIGILAHVDSGKTTLSEALLYRTGEIRRLGRVDRGDAFLDTNEIERERGITIFAKQALLNIGGTSFTLVDTPGHIDFSPETERVLQILDYAVLVISGTDGVQTHTETLWKLLIRYNVPTFVFVNKTDISRKTQEDLMSEINAKLSDRCVNFSDKTDFYERVAENDENLMNEFLESDSLKDDSVAAAVAARTVFPCFFGSALKLVGVDEFAEGMAKYTVQPRRSDEFGAKVFKISEDENGTRLTHMKITSGSLTPKTLLSGYERDGGGWEEKADRIRLYNGDKFELCQCAEQGMTVAVTGLTKTYSGEGLGIEGDTASPYLEPVLTYKIELLDGTDPHIALIKLRRLEEEDPQLHIIQNEVHREIHIQLMGEVQIEVLRKIIRDRFGMEVDFDRGAVSYRETIANTVEGVGHFEPLRHYAEVHLILEPLPRGKGLVFETNCSEDTLDRNWQRLILTHLKEKNHIGVLTGAPITDMKITLAAGRAHKKHTEGGDFRQATYRAVRQGLRGAESVLLEPCYNFRMEIPTACVGRAMTDLQRMGGEFAQPDASGETSIISGSAPVSEMRDYYTDLTAYTAGRGKLFCTVKGYEPCHNADEVIAAAAYDADADLDNPCDSVFCAHGAGFLVKWDEVPDYMHIESCLSNSGGAEDAAVHVSRYMNAVVNDEELLRIFEKTYGKVKRDAYTAVKQRTKPAARSPKSPKSSVPPDGPWYLLVDGYNMIFSWDDLRRAAQENLESARQTLINRMCNYCGYKDCVLILVFDAYKVKDNPGSIEKIHNIHVVYTKEAETADMYIERVTHEIGKKHKVRVATSDNLEQVIILGAGAIRVSAAEFEREVTAAEEEIRKFISGIRN